MATPTDTIGQHIHLVKFDVTSSDGSGNGFNYEDGTFSHGAVEERIHAASGLAVTSAGERKRLAIGKDLDGKQIDRYQTTVQRWFADPLLAVNSKMRATPPMPCMVLLRQTEPVRLMLTRNA